MKNSTKLVKWFIYYTLSQKKMNLQDLLIHKLSQNYYIRNSSNWLLLISLLLRVCSTHP